MKALIVFLLLSLLTGCDDGERYFLDENEKDNFVIVTVERQIDGDTNHMIFITAKKAYTDSNAVFMECPCFFSQHENFSYVAVAKEGNLKMSLLPGAQYEIHIKSISKQK